MNIIALVIVLAVVGLVAYAVINVRAGLKTYRRGQAHRRRARQARAMNRRRFGTEAP